MTPTQSIGSLYTSLVNWAFPTTLDQALQMSSQADKAPHGPFAQFCQAFEAREQTRLELETLFKALDSEDRTVTGNAHAILHKIVNLTQDSEFSDLVRKSHDFRDIQWVWKDAFSRNSFVRRRAAIASKNYWKEGEAPLFLRIADAKLDKEFHLQEKERIYKESHIQEEGLIFFQAAMQDPQCDLFLHHDLLKRATETAFELLNSELRWQTSLEFFHLFFDRMGKRELDFIAPFFTRGCQNPIQGKYYDTGNSRFLYILSQFLNAHHKRERVIEIVIETLIKECESENYGRIITATCYWKEVKKHDPAIDLEPIIAHCKELQKAAFEKYAQNAREIRFY